MRLEFKTSKKFKLNQKIANSKKQKVLLAPGESEILIVHYNGVKLEFDPEDWKDTPDGVFLYPAGFGQQGCGFSGIIIGIDGHPLAIDAVIKLLPRGNIDVYSAPEWELDRNSTNIGD